MLLAFLLEDTGSCVFFDGILIETISQGNISDGAHRKDLAFNFIKRWDYTEHLVSLLLINIIMFNVFAIPAEDLPTGRPFLKKEKSTGTFTILKKEKSL